MNYKTWICKLCGETYMDLADDIPIDEICNACKEEEELLSAGNY